MISVCSAVTAAVSPEAPRSGGQFAGGAGQGRPGHPATAFMPAIDSLRRCGTPRSASASSAESPPAHRERGQQIRLRNLSVGDSGRTTTVISQGSRGCLSTPHDHGAGRSRGRSAGAEFLPRPGGVPTTTVAGLWCPQFQPAAAQDGNSGPEIAADHGVDRRSLPAVPGAAGLGRVGVRGGRQRTPGRGWRRIPTVGRGQLVVAGRHRRRPLKNSIERPGPSRQWSGARATGGEVLGRNRTPARWLDVRSGICNRREVHPAVWTTQLRWPAGRLEAGRRAAAAPDMPEPHRWPVGRNIASAAAHSGTFARRDAGFRIRVISHPLKPTPAFFGVNSKSVGARGFAYAADFRAAQFSAKFRRRRGGRVCSGAINASSIRYSRAAACRHRRIDLAVAGARFNTATTTDSASVL